MRNKVFKSVAFGRETTFGLPMEKRLPSITGVGDIRYKEWTRKEWSGLYQELYTDNPLQEANDTIWEKWTDPKNKKSKYFNDVKALIINLGTYRSQDSIGQVFYITWESQPVYNTWSNWWNDVEYWQLIQWQMWYKELKLHFGKIEAQKQFQNAWSYSENWGSFAISPTSDDSMGLKGGYDCDFINFFRHEGIDVALFGAENLCTLVSTGTNLIDATENVSEAIEVTTGAIANIMPYLLLTVAGLTIYSQVKRINK